MFKFLVISFFLVTTLWSDLSYQIQDLGTLNQHSSEATSINNRCEVVGRLKAELSKNPQPFYWMEGSEVKKLECRTMSRPIINNEGIVAGCFVTGWFSWSPFVWNPETSTFIDLGPSFHSSIFYDHFFPLSFNDLEEMLVMSDSPYITLWKKDQITAFPQYPFYFYLNNHGHLLGRNHSLVVIYNTNNQTVIELSDLENHIPYRLNDHNQVIGITPSKKDGFLWDSLLGKIVLPSFIPYALNNEGVIIGCWKGRDGAEIPAIWKNGVLIPIENIVTNLTHHDVWLSIKNLLGINDHGDIVGVGITKTNQEHAILLRKVN